MLELHKEAVLLKTVRRSHPRHRGGIRRVPLAYQVRDLLDLSFELMRPSEGVGSLPIRGGKLFFADTLRCPSSHTSANRRMNSCVVTVGWAPMVTRTSAAFTRFDLWRDQEHMATYTAVRTTILTFPFRSAEISSDGRPDMDGEVLAVWTARRLSRRYEVCQGDPRLRFGIPPALSSVVNRYG